MRPTILGLVALLSVACAHGSSADSSKMPNHETDQFAFDVVKVTAECLAANPPLTPGKVLVSADMASAGSPARLFDAGSTSGNKASLACAVKRAAGELETPHAPPKRYLHVLVVLPGGPEDVLLKFADSPSSPY